MLGALHGDTSGRRQTDQQDCLHHDGDLVDAMARTVGITPQDNASAGLLGLPALRDWTQAKKRIDPDGYRVEGFWEDLDS